jgi:membrane protein YqaA with SNARE-associated domain
MDVMATPSNALAKTPASVGVQHAAAAAKHAAGRAHHAVLPHWLIHLGGLGVFAVAAVDSSPIPLAIPGSTDLLLLLLVSHHGNPVLLAACAILGATLGGYITWSTGKRGGEALLKRSVPARYRAQIERWTETHSLLSVFLPPILPPPVPLTPFVLAAGALGVSRRRFLVAFTLARAARYSLVAWAGVVYGRRVVRWYTTTLAGWAGVIGWSFAALLVVGIALGIWQYRRQRTVGVEEAASVEVVPAA